MAMPMGDALARNMPAISSKSFRRSVRDPVAGSSVL